MNSKRGISAIVATILIILITIAGITILWTSILPMINNKFSFSDPDARLNVVTSGGYTVYDPMSRIAIVQVKRGPDKSEMRYLRITFKFSGNSYSSVVDAPAPNQKKTYAFNLTVGNFPDPEMVEVSPIFVVGNTESEGSISSSVTVPYGTLDPIPSELLNLTGDYRGQLPSCSDGIQNQGETSTDCGGPCPSCSVSCTDVDNDNYCLEASGSGCDNSGCTSGWSDCNDADNKAWLLYPANTYHLDGDGDNYGRVAFITTTFCSNVTHQGAVTDGTDCNDGNSAIHPGATEVCSGGVDEDCDGATDCVDSGCTGNPSCGSYPPTSVMSNLVNFWNMDEVSGTTFIDHMGRTNGSANGAQQTVSGYIGKGALFSGNGFIFLSNAVSINLNNGSIAMWVKSSSNFMSNYGYQGHLATSDSQFFSYLSITGNGTSPYGIVGETDLDNSDYYISTPSGVAPYGVWNHLVVSFENKVTKVYLNGALINTQSAVQASTFTFNKLGGRDTEYFTGTIDEVMVFNRSLGSGEVTQLSSYHL